MSGPGTAGARAPEGGPTARGRGWILGGAVLEGLLLLGWAPLSPGADALRWVGILVAGGLVHLALCERALRSGLPFGPRETRIALLLAGLFRLTVLPIEPTLSGDAYRHVWDGRVQAAGLDPYRHAPVDPALEGLRDGEVWPRINHPELRTVYPPAAQRISRAAADVHRGLAGAGASAVTSWKATLFLVEFAGAALLAWGLARAGRGAAFLVYGWSPLAVVEFYGSGHVDAAGVGLLAGAVGCHLLGRKFAAGALFSGALLTKGFPVALLPFGLRLGSRWRMLLGAGAAAALLALPFLRSSRESTASLAAFGSNWGFHGVLHEALRVDAWAAMPRRAKEGNWADMLRDGDPPEKLRGRIAAGLLAIGVCAFVLRRKAPLAAAAVAGLFVFLLLQPVVFPWYATWTLPLLALAYRRSVLLWTALVPSAYEVLIGLDATGSWSPSPWVPVLALAPALALFAREARRGALAPAA